MSSRDEASIKWQKQKNPLVKAKTRKEKYNDIVQSKGVLNHVIDLQ